jgi:hypothetical protein
MKITTILSLFFFQIIFSQCKVNDFVPFSIGANRFETSKILNKLVTKQREEIYGSDTYSRWEKFSYIEKDSVFLVTTIKRFVPNECFKGFENGCQLYFVDDILYRISMYQEFRPSEYDEMINTYNHILNGYDNIFEYSMIFTTKNSITNEKIGEGFVFYDNPPNEKVQEEKVKEIRLSYEITYKQIYNKSSQKYEQTSDIDYYTILIKSVDLNGTKLSNLGY